MKKLLKWQEKELARIQKLDNYYLFRELCDDYPNDQSDDREFWSWDQICDHLFERLKASGFFGDEV